MDKHAQHAKRLPKRKPILIKGINYISPQLTIVFKITLMTHFRPDSIMRKMGLLLKEVLLP
jgi:hypothetical protein